MASLRSELQNIYNEYGELTPRLVYEQAKEDPDSSLYSHVFHVDTDEAAERYYIDRCRRLIAKIKIVRRPSDEAESYRIRAYHSVPTSTGMAYKHTDDITDNQFARKLVLQEMKRDWNQLKRKYEHMAEFFALVESDLPPGGTGEAESG